MCTQRGDQPLLALLVRVIGLGLGLEVRVGGRG